jgi:hypothetical protein
MKNDKPSIVVIDMFDDENLDVLHYIDGKNYVPSEDYIQESDFILSNDPIRLRFQVNIPKLIMAFIALPPIEYFYGRTPLKEWISRCKPFEPKGLGKSVISIKAPNSLLSETYLLYLDAWERDVAFMKKQELKYLRIRTDEV